MSQVSSSFPALSGAGATEGWYLEAVGEEDAVLRRIPLRDFPYQIGRRADMALCLANPTVSKVHAEIYIEGGRPWLRDLESTNGTFVNGQRIRKPTPLCPGSNVHFGQLQFLVGKDCTTNNEATVEDIPREWIGAVCQFDRLFEPGVAIPYFQPVVALATQKTLGYEVLARSTIDGLNTPHEMFELAHRLHQENEVSRMFRALGVELGQALPLGCSLFLNTHPAEVRHPSLIESLADLRARFPERPMVLEIHESIVTDKAQMRVLVGQLREMNIRLAYDDFGAGRDRLMDLVETPPDVLKFDAGFIRGIHLADNCRRQVVQSLIRMVRDLGVAALAEGVESAEEHEVCCQVGFDCAQGYFYGRPRPLEEYLTAPAR